MINAVLIEDEPKAQKVLSGLVKKYLDNVELVSTADNIKEGIHAIMKHNPAIVFLDIELQGENGFELFDYLPKRDFEVIFTTAYNQYAIDAFKCSALDYLLKPINIQDLKSAIDKAMIRLRSAEKMDKLDILIENIKMGSRQQQKIVIPNSDGFTVVRICDIVRCEAASNYCTFVLQDGSKLMVSKTLKEYESLLAQIDFLRVHQSHLINLHHVKKYARGNARYLILSDNVHIPVSNARREEFLEKFARL